MSAARVLMAGTDITTMGGVSSVVAVYKEAGLFDRHRIDYLTTHRDGTYLGKLAAFLSGFFQLSGLLLRRRIELLHVHMCSRKSCWRKLCFIWPALAMRVPVVVHLHGGDFAEFYDKECGSIRRGIIRKTFSRATRVIVLSDSWRRWVQRTCSTAVVATLHNPVALPALEEGVSESDSHDLICLGRLGEHKGTYDLLEATARLIKRQPKVSLWLCGDGEIEKCRRAAETLGLANVVHFPGWVRGETKARLLRRSRIFVLPSYREGLPMGVLEAMAAGLPVVTTNVGGIPETITDGIEGFLIEPGDIEALTDRLSRLMDDPILSTRMGRAGRARVEQAFAAEKIVKQLEAIYAELGVRW